MHELAPITNRLYEATSTDDTTVTVKIGIDIERISRYRKATSTASSTGTPYLVHDAPPHSHYGPSPPNTYSEPDIAPPGATNEYPGLEFDISPNIAYGVASDQSFL